MMTLRIGLVPEIGHMPLQIRTVGCIEAIQDVEWLQRLNVADVTVHEQGDGKVRVFGFSMIFYMFLVHVSLLKINYSYCGDKFDIEPR